MKNFSLCLLLIFVLCSVPWVAAEDAIDSANDDGFLVRFFPSERGKTSDRLTVRPQSDPQNPASGIELLITNETYYDARQARFREREVAYITGPGLGSRGLFFLTDDEDHLRTFGDILESFTEREARFSKKQEQAAGLNEEWVGDGMNAFDGSVNFGQLQLAGRARPSAVTINWTFEPDRRWLSFDDFININHQIAPVVLTMVRGIPSYSAQRTALREELAARREQIRLMSESDE